jgi:hypothetical protein
MLNSLHLRLDHCYLIQIDSVTTQSLVMKLIVVTMLSIVLLRPISNAQEAPGRYQLVVAQAAKDWMMPSMVFKIDTATGATWVYRFVNVDVPDKYRSAFPKGVRVDGWEPIPASLGNEAHNAMTDFPAFLRSAATGSSPTPSQTP